MQPKKLLYWSEFGRAPWEWDRERLRSHSAVLPERVESVKL